MADFSAFRTLHFTARAPRVAGGGRADVSVLTRADPDGGYRSAAAAWTRWRRDGLVAAAPGRALWALEITAPDGARQSGLLAALRLDDQVRPHEEIEATLVARRLSRLQAVPVDLAPVAVYTDRRVEVLAGAIRQQTLRAADLDVVDEQRSHFRLWRMDDEHALHAALAAVRVVVADGHHRVAAARRATGGAAPGVTLAFIMPDEPRSRPVHRQLHTDDPDGLLQRLATLFELHPVADSAALEQDLSRHTGPACFGLRLADDRSWLLLPRDPEELLGAAPRDHPDAWRRLDQVQWTHGVLPHLPGVTSLPAASSVLDRTSDGQRPAALLLLRPIPTSVVTELAVAGTVMPPKVTWFYPKARTGLLLRAPGPDDPEDR